MVANSLVLGAALLGVGGTVLYVLSTALPNLAHVRLTRRIVDMRLELDAMLQRNRRLVRDRDVSNTLELMSDLLLQRQPVGMGLVLVSLVHARRNRESLTTPGYAVATRKERNRLRTLDRDFTMEILRASFLGSRLWPVSWLGWVLIKWYMRPQAVAAGTAQDRETTIEVAASEAAHLHVEETRHGRGELIGASS